jgi:hypothetical protein
MQKMHKNLMFPFLLFLIMAAAAGCGDSNPAVTFDPDTGHPSGWFSSSHEAAAEDNPDSCTECHGKALEGGISGVGCTGCHMGGIDSYHPDTWGASTYHLHDDYVLANGTAECSNVACHGTYLGGVPGSGPSCTSCHMGGVTSVHPATWTNGAFLDHRDYVDNNGDTACRNATCHGINLEGDPNTLAPRCNNCHGYP